MDRISEETRARIAAAWPRILNGIASGDLVRDVLKAHGVSYGMIRAFLRLEPARRVEWEDAREESADAFMDEALDVARDPMAKLGEDGTIIRLDAAHARTRIDTLKWAARIRNPRAYSDKQQLDVNVKTLDLTRIISEANARLASGRAPRTLEQAAPALLEHVAARHLADLL